MDYKEKVIAILNSQELSKEQKEKLESIFPELKKSEDEKIRKALINQFSDYKRRGENHGFGYSNDKILAWLEKQGEQSKTLQTDDVPNESSTAAPLMTGAIGFDGEPMESKPCEYNPTRSEEDEKMLNDILMCGEHHCYLDAGNIAWLKSLKERYTWKPSDEQMEAVRLAAEIGTANNSWAMNILKSMYQDLQKLREE